MENFRKGKGELSKEKIDSLLPEGEYETPIQAIIAITQWAVPHWDWAIKIRMGAVKVSPDTAMYLIGRLQKIFPDKKQELLFDWLEYGWSQDFTLSNWECMIDFSKIDY